MKKLISLVVVVVIVGAAPASAGARRNLYYTVVCNGVEFESVDARAVEQGGYTNALSLFPRADCVLAGPFTNS